MSRRPYYRRRPDLKVVKFMCAADGYVMARIPGCIPFVERVHLWNSWPECDRDGNPLARAAECEE
jgi:hypothetical protein